MLLLELPTRLENVDLERRIIPMRQCADRWNEMRAPKRPSGRRDIPPNGANGARDPNRMAESLPEGPATWSFPTGKGNPESHANLYHRAFMPLMIVCGGQSP